MTDRRPSTMPPPGAASQDVLRVLDLLTHRGLFGEALAVVEAQLLVQPGDAFLKGRKAQIEELVARFGAKKETDVKRTKSTRPPRKLSPGRVVAEKYRLEARLAHGAMSQLWVATHLALDSKVVVKFINMALLDSQSFGEDDDDEEGSDSRGLALARFEREAKAAAQLRSANVVQVFDYGVDEDTPYIVMEFLEGEDLAARITRLGRLRTDELHAILSPVAYALSRAHEAGIVHRDLKPQNLFLAKEGERDVPKILDFGVAKTMRGGDVSVESSTLEGTVVGTPHYMSPEQAMGRQHIDTRSDLWSLGVIAFHALTGQRPFQATALLETVVAICSAPIPVPSSLAPELGPDVDAFFVKALARDPDQRFQSAREFEAAFAALVHRSPARMSAASLAKEPALALASPRASSPAKWAVGGLAVLALGVVAFLLAAGDDDVGTTAPPVVGASPTKAVAPPPATAAGVATTTATIAEVASAAPSASASASASAQPTETKPPPGNTAKWKPPSTSRPPSTGTGRDVGY